MCVEYMEVLVQVVRTSDCLQIFCLFKLFDIFIVKLLMEKKELEEHLKNGLSLRKISETTNKSLTTIRYWINKYDLKVKDFYEKWSEIKLNILVKNSKSKSDILKKMGLTLNAGNYRTLKKYITKYEIDDSNLKYDFKISNEKNRKYSDSDIFCLKSEYSSAHLKGRIIRSKLLEYKCKECGNIGEWNDKKLILQIDHINGVNNDNRIDNLRFLCPNCHSQTQTFSIGQRKTK